MKKGGKPMTEKKEALKKKLYSQFEEMRGKAGQGQSDVVLGRMEKVAGQFAGIAELIEEGEKTFKELLEELDSPCDSSL